MTTRAFVSEPEAYGLLAGVGIAPPRHGTAGQQPPFVAGEPVVLKGIGDGVWHKSELGAVHFADFDLEAIALETARMRHRIEWAGHAWLGGLVCERIAFLRQEGLPSEGFVSLSRGEAGWMVMLGFGGLQADALAHLAPPCCWPVDTTSPEEAVAEFEDHPLGRTWLGRVRATRPLTSRERLLAFLQSLWRLLSSPAAADIELLEINPVVIDAQGALRPLDAVGRRAPRPMPPRPPPAGFLLSLRAPGRIALAGVSSDEHGVGRTILENLQRCPGLAGHLLLIKPGQTRFLGLPCLPDVSGLRGKPVDLLILALPAAVAVGQVEALVRQGGGARSVALVAGGIGDGADRDGLGARLVELLQQARIAGQWTPAVLGPNFLGHWVPAAGLDTSFIPTAKLAPPAPESGELTLLSQSGAFLLCRRSRQPALRFRLGIALGNQLDVSMTDVLEELAAEPQPGPVACYVEGFGAGQLARFAAAARALRPRGASVLVHRAGRTDAGRTAATTHTGAMAGNWTMEREVLERSGVRVATTIADFDAALTWLDAQPRPNVGPVGLVTNAGFESVNAGDQFDRSLVAASLPEEAVAELAGLLESRGLGGLVTPRLPLDLTPMADEGAFLAAADLVLRHAAVLVVGLVPFTRRLATSGAAAQEFAAHLAELARRHDKPVGVAVDAGAAYEEYRAAFTALRLPVFDRVETALRGLRVLA